MKLHFAGAEASKDRDLLNQSGVKNTLVSYHYYKDTPVTLNNGTVLVDSGGFTARTQGVVISVEQYASYLIKNDVKLAFNLDTNSVRETLKNQKYLETYTNTYIIPVYHTSDYLECRELLQDYLKYSYISVGGTLGVSSEIKKHIEPFFDYTIYHTRDKVRVHGLGVTRQKWLERYPFYSVDSTSWLQVRKFGRSKVVTDSYLQKYRSKKTSGDKRLITDISYWLKLERNITSYWQTKGVTWEDFRC